MRIVGFILLALVALYGLGIGALALAQRRFLYPGAYTPGQRALAVPEGTRAVAVETADGERLHGLWAPPRPGCGVVLSFHGNGSRPEFHAERFAGPPWREAGWGVLAIAYRGFPGSTGSPSEAGLIADGRAAYRYVAEHAAGASVLLHGHSLGAAVAIAVAQDHAHLGLYLEAPFDSMRHTARLHMPYVPTGLFLRDTYRSDRLVAGGTAPILIVHGAQDGVVPAKLGLLLARAAGPRARFEPIPGDHESIFGSKDVEAEALFRPVPSTACRVGTAAR